MSHLPGESGVESRDSLSRRDFLRAGVAGAAGLTLTGLATAPAAPAPAKAVNCIFLFLTGGPSHIDTWDPKPDAPAEVRGPFRPTRTNVPGVLLSEHFPRMARMADRFALVRSVHHDAAPIHETGQQLLQTGRLSRGGVDYPNIGAALDYHEPDFTWSVLLGQIQRTGVSVSHGQTAGYLGDKYKPRNVALEARYIDIQQRPALREYGQNPFGLGCFWAFDSIMWDVRMVTVTMFDSVFNQPTWDCHADGGSLATNLDDYKNTLCPMFDRAYTALLEDLHQRGLLETTLVVAAGEFGRTPYLNPRGGRDHWPGCWTVLLAGGGVRGGQVIGASDRIGAAPADRPVHAAEIAATIYHALGVDPATQLPGPDGRPISLTDARPVLELFEG